MSPRDTRSWTVPGALLGMLLAAMLATGAAAQSGDADAGKAVYDANCAACHQPGGTGIPGAFPPLAGNPAVQDAAHVTEVIRNGLSGEIEVLGVTYNGVMPSVALDDQQILDVIAYLQSLGGATTTTTTVPGGTQPPTGGDPEPGERLFTGRAGLEAGGPACMACHKAGSYGQLNGPGLGPDLTNAVTRLGGTQGMSGWLASPPTPTMNALFSDKPLSEGEIGDLVAFFEQTSFDGREGGIDFLWILGLAGVAALFGLLALFVKRPGPTYHDRLRSES